MKVLCIDTFTDGHHCSYMNGINNIENVEFRFVLPKSVKDILNRKQNIIEYEKLLLTLILILYIFYMGIIGIDILVYN